MFNLTGNQRNQLRTTVVKHFAHIFEKFGGHELWEL